MRIDLSFPVDGVEETILMLYEDEEVSLDKTNDKLLQSSQTNPKNLDGL